MSNSSTLVTLLTLAAAMPLCSQQERESTTPTATVWLPVATVSTIDGLINAGYRITDLEVVNAGASTFSVSMVHNSGAYAVSSWWWYFGQTASQVSSLLAQNTARPIDIDTYLDGLGNRRYAVVMVSNAGAAHRAYQVFYGSTSATIGNFTANNNHRIVDLDGYDSGGSRLYAAITWPNTGSDNRAWWWYLGQSSAQVSILLFQNSARPIDLERNSDGTYDVVMNQVAGKWWYFYGLTSAQVIAQANQIGARIADIEPRGRDTYDVILNNNSNALTTRISDILRTGTSGFLGAYLRRVDDASSEVLAALHASTPFEPASTMKTLHHVHAMKRVSLGATSLGQNMTTFLGLSGTCPTGSGSSVVEPQQDVLRLMMRNSDNARTLTIENYYQRANINSTAQALGMTHTGINHNLGCAGPIANTTSLVDLGRLYRHVASGYLGAQRETFYDLMINSRTFPAVGTLSIESIITAEAAAVGVSGTLLSTFRSLVRHVTKGGNYDLPGNFDGCFFGYVSLPRCANGRVVAYEYALGAFFNDATEPEFDAVGIAYCELLREEIRAALQTWVGTTLGSIAYFGAGCAGTSGTPLAVARGEPQLGDTVTYTVTSGPASVPGALYLGGSTTLWNGVPLPLDLAVIGAPGCRMLTDPTLRLSMATNASGTGDVSLAMPVDLAFLGQRFHCQFYLVNPPANALGLIVSRGVTTVIGKNLP